MEITEIIVSYESKQNVGNYSNVTPHITMKVALTEDDDPDRVLADVTTLVRTTVQREVDAALEANDLPPLYTTEPRYQVLVRHGRRDGGLETVVVIAPVGTKLTGLSSSRSGFRLDAIRQQAERHYSDALVIDTTIDPDALQPILHQIAVEDAAIAEERARQEREREERWRREREERARQRDAAQEEADDDDDDDEED